MLSVIQFAVIFNHSKIDFIFQHVLIIRDGKHFAFLANQAQGIDNLSDLREGVFASSIHFKSPLDILRLFFINGDTASVLVVHIAQWRPSGPNSISQFLANTPLYISCRILPLFKAGDECNTFPSEARAC